MALPRQMVCEDGRGAAVEAAAVSSVQKWDRGAIRPARALQHGGADALHIFKQSAEQSHPDGGRTPGGKAGAAWWCA